MTFLDIYLPEIHIQHKSVFGESSSIIQWDSPDMGTSILQVFLNDNDIQEITTCSSNIGFVRTYTKIYRKDRG